MSPIGSAICVVPLSCATKRCPNPMKNRLAGAASACGGLYDPAAFDVQLPDASVARAQHQPPLVRQGIVKQARDPGQLAVTADH